MSCRTSVSLRLHLCCCACCLSSQMHAWQLEGYVFLQHRYAKNASTELTTFQRCIIIHLCRQRQAGTEAPSIHQDRVRTLPLTCNGLTAGCLGSWGSVKQAAGLGSSALWTQLLKCAKFDSLKGKRQHVALQVRQMQASHSP